MAHIKKKKKKAKPNALGSFKVQFNSVTQSHLTVNPWTAACQASLSITNSQSLLKVMELQRLPSYYMKTEKEAIYV